MTQRIAQIKSWLQNDYQADILSFESASSDASFRRYFRVKFNHSLFEQSSRQSFIVMDAPPEKESIIPFIDIDRKIEQLGINVPHLYAINRDAGFILMSDLGNTPYLSLLSSNFSEERPEKLYSDAMSALLVMQRGIHRDSFVDMDTQLADYTSDRLRQEMQLLPDWYARVHCQQELTIRDIDIIDQAMNRLIDSALEQPQVFVHRDYHSRNLMYVEEHNPGVIDFQDALMGPVSYDLVSLLRDSYIAWPEEQIYDWVEQYRQILIREKLLVNETKEQFIRWFDWMGIQRQLKVAGIFCRLNYRDGKTNYLNDIPQTLDYLFNVASRYPEFDDLLKLIRFWTERANNSAAIKSPGLTSVIS